MQTPSVQDTSFRYRTWVHLEHHIALQPTDRKEMQQLMAGIWMPKPEVCSKNICLTYVNHTYISHVMQSDPGPRVF